MENDVVACGLLTMVCAMLSTYTRIAVMYPLAAVPPAEIATGELTVALFAGEQMVAPGAAGTQLLVPLAVKLSEPIT
jgi:hypothetical protein